MFPSFGKGMFRSNTTCCELVLQARRYLTILQFESHRLNVLQQECNQLLDKFYALKDQFSSLEAELPLKYFGEENVLACKEYISEFSAFIENVWHIGKHRFSERGKKTQYECFVGCSLSEIMASIQCFVEEAFVQLSHMPQHSECAAAMHSCCSQIVAELHGDCLGTAGACFRQHTYLQAAIPFLLELNALIQQYLLITDIHTPKQFVDQVILRIPPYTLPYKQVTDEMVPFMFVIDLLNGKLLDKEVLDQNSDIKPIVEDDHNFKSSILVMRVVTWIMQLYKCPDVPNCWENIVPPVISFDVVSKRRAYGTEKHGVGNSMHSFNQRRNLYQSDIDISDLDESSLNILNSDWPGMYNIRKSYPTKRKNRKTGSMSSESHSAIDLQPIKLHTLQTPLLLPLPE